VNLRIALLILLTPAFWADALEPIEIENQYGREVAIFPGNGPRVIVYADRKGRRQTDSWKPVLAGGACLVIEAANLDAVPFLVRPFVRNAFDDASPVVLDWKGEIAERLGFEPDSANLYLIGRNGELLAHVTGPADEASAARLESLMREHCDERD
jgi:hypothetical protein